MELQKNMLKCLLVQLKKYPPIVTMALIFSCLISTIPQLFLPELYNTLSGQYPNLNHFYFLALPAFTHSPGMLIIHLTGNLLVFLLFGSMIEIIIGSSRFAFISLLTFISTTGIDYLHANGGSGHGASGIAWGYHVFFIFILIIMYEEKGKKVFKDIFVLLLLLLVVFDLFGIPIFEVVVSKQIFFDNFGQTLHLVSMVVVTPFVLLWRKDIEKNVVKLLAFERAEERRKSISPSVVLIFLLIIMNIYGTVKLATISLSYSEYITYSIVPAEGTDIKQIPRCITIKFDNPMKINSEELIGKSIWCETEEPLIYETKWVDDKTLEVRFPREFIDNESLKLQYIFEAEVDNGISIKKPIKLEYE